MSAEIERREGGSVYRGTLPKGCVLCAQGAKMVLLVTGRCSSSCFYCPLSEYKMGRDVVYADEMPVEKDDDIIYEGKMIDALGTGITGGDPLVVFNRTLHYIDLLKEKFGEKHHIHLYTASGNMEAYKILAEHGLDEIRIHPPPEVWGKIENTIYGKRIMWAVKTDMDVGVEVPAIPGYEEGLIHLIRFSSEAGVKFVNLNELEFSETNAEEMLKRGFDVKSDVSSAAKGSEELAVKIVKNVDVPITVHYCSSSFKDAVQMKNRIKRRAKNVAKDYEVITEEGTLILGVIYADDITLAYKKIKEEFEIPENLIAINYDRNRVEMAPWILEEIAEEIEYDAYEVEEYPTYDRLQVESLKLN